jgi:beta-N-acetylhexosaminidase
MSLGPIMLDIAGLEPSDAERELLAHPAVAGVVLFSRNYASPEQLAALTGTLHALREPPLLVAVDHEGGRVQRFRSGFSPLPAAARFGEAYDRDQAEGLALAQAGGWLMAAELRALGVDFSFAPVLDLRVGRSAVIGDRAFHREAEAVARIAQAFVRGMRSAGMAAVGKHYPGHGHVAEDSHLTLPEDDRDLETLRLADLAVFARLVRAGIPALMPAHVVYPRVDRLPAGFSPVWLKGILRDQLGFQGALFSDDLAMAGAAAAGSIPDRAGAALEAGCDVVLVCNRPEEAAAVVTATGAMSDPVRGARLARMHGAGPGARAQSDPRHADAVRRVCSLTTEPELDLGDDTPL